MRTGMGGNIPRLISNSFAILLVASGLAFGAESVEEGVRQASVLGGGSLAAQPAASNRKKEFATIPPPVVQVVKSEQLAKQAWELAISPNEYMLCFAELDAVEEESPAARG